MKYFMNRHKIDINFDFTSDTPRYWDNYWECDSILGAFNNDPDSASKTLKLYHKLLYSKQLPNGEVLDITAGNGANYLTWKNFRFGSDSIIASFRYKNNRNFMKKVAETIPNYQQYIENYIHKSYTIGGEIIFPKRSGGINQSRGCNHMIRDRWDLTLECIRKFYLGEISPLYSVLMHDKPFFDLFVDFKGYIDFFYLQDCVSKDYSKINFWIGDGSFTNNPLPKSVDEWVTYIDKELEFVEKRNQRIKTDCLLK